MLARCGLLKRSGVITQPLKNLLALLAAFQNWHEQSFRLFAMMKKLEVMTVVGNRPEIIRPSRVLARLDEHCDHVLVYTGQNYDCKLNQNFLDDLGIRKPDHFFNAAGSGAAETIGKIIIAVDGVLAAGNPDAMLVLGDTNSCLAVLPAKRRQVPGFHMEAGNRCFDQREPEEINRRIVDHTADINLTYSSIARESLLRDGLPPDMEEAAAMNVHCARSRTTACPMSRTSRCASSTATQTTSTAWCGKSTEGRAS